MSLIKTLSIVVFSLSLLLSGCASVPQTPTHQALSEDDLPEVSAPHTRHIPADTLYALLTAEIAGQRQRYDIALVHYLRQAKTTKDPLIAERAARIAQFTGQHDAMLQALTIWLEADNDNPAAHIVAAQLFMEQGDFDSALQHLQQLQALTGNGQYDFLAANASTLSKTKQQQLLQKLHDIRQQHPEDASLWLASSLLLQYLENYPAALKDAEHALKLAPELLSASLQKARLLALLDRPNQAIKYLNKLQKKHPDHKGIQVLKARVLIDSKRMPEALSAFDSLHRNFPDDASILLSLALLHEEVGQRELAREYLYELLAVQEFTNEAHFYLGRMADQEDLDDLAIEQYSQVGGGNEFLPANMRAAMLSQKHYGLSAAQDFLAEQREAYPQYYIGLVRIEVELLLDHKEFVLADKTLSLALAQHANNIELLYSRAMLAESQGKLDQLERDLRHILQLEPQNINALNALGYTFADHKYNLDEALDLVQQAYQLSPNNAAIIDSLGWVYFRRGDIAQALPLLQRAFEMIHDHEIAAHYGEVLWFEGQQQQAKEVWLKGLDGYPESPIIEETLQRLKINLD